MHHSGMKVSCQHACPYIFYKITHEYVVMENKERYLKINLTLLKIVIAYTIKISCYAIFKFDVYSFQIFGDA